VCVFLCVCVRFCVRVVCVCVTSVTFLTNLDTYRAGYLVGISVILYHM